MLHRALWQPDWFLRGYKALLQLRGLWQTDWFLQWYKAPLQLRCALYSLAMTSASIPVSWRTGCTLFGCPMLHFNSHVPLHLDHTTAELAMGERSRMRWHRHSHTHSHTA